MGLCDLRDMDPPLESLDAPGWQFFASEDSCSAYQIEGRRADGRSVSRPGSDFDALFKECIDDAKSLHNSRT
jgi:hypothetical protein